MGNNIKKVGIVIKHSVPEANQYALQMAEILKKRKVEVAFASESKDVCTQAMGTLCQSKEELISTCDFIVVLGGDGTFISVGRLMIEKSIPILGVNMGQLGFLTEFKLAEIEESLIAAINGELEISERTMLECTLKRGKELLIQSPIVNDVVISKGEIARIFDIEVNVDGRMVAKIKGDGLIISTPTGSTAYTLAAGGPVLEPKVPAMAMTAVCPHAVTLRPLIIHDTAEVTLIPQFKACRVILTLDGQKSFDLELGDLIRVTRYNKHAMKMFVSPKRDYYALLREKLKYGYRD